MVWREPEHGIAEIAGVPEVVLAEFSARAEDVADRLAEKLDRFRHGMEREPTARERWRLEREAVVESRPGKARAVEAGLLHDQWTAQLRDLGWEPAPLVRQATGQARERRVRPQDVDRLVADAMTALSEQQSTWRPAEVVRALAAAVPTWARFPAEQLVPWLDDLAAEMVSSRMVDLSRPIPAGVRLRRDGRPVSESALDRALTTNAILNEERALVEWAYQRLLDGGRPLTEILNDDGIELTVGQAETAAAVAGNQELVLVVGPAGTGKTTALRPGIDQLHADGRARVRRRPDGGGGAGVGRGDRRRRRHARQAARRALAASGRPATATTSRRAPPSWWTRPAWSPPRSWPSWPRWPTNAAGGSRSIGDPLQFSAVGRSGMFAHLVDTYGAVELDEVHRFTNPWERAASLRLRRGDTSVLDLYEQAGRIHGGDQREMEREILHAWAQARAAGETVAMLASTNETVVRLNQLAQRERIADGELQPGRTVAAGPYRIHAGDEIATRQNQRQLLTDHGRSVKNRDQWTVDAVHRGGNLTVTGPTGTVRLPAEYVARHVELAYAQTSHAAQGRTLDRSLLLVDGPTDCRGIYVPMTRGRHSNEAFVVTDTDRTARDTLEAGLAQNWIDVPALVRQAELARPDRPSRRPSTDRTALIPRAALAARDRATPFRPDHRPRPALSNTPPTSSRSPRTTTPAPSPTCAIRRVAATPLSPCSVNTIGRSTAASTSRRSTTPAAPSPTPTASPGSKPASPSWPPRSDCSNAQAHDLDRQAPDRSRWASDLAQVRGELADDLALRTRRAPRDAGVETVMRLGARPTECAAARLWDTAAARIDQHRTAFPDISGQPPRPR